MSPAKKEARLAEEGGADAVHLEVRESNAAARKLYESLGFAVEDRLENYYGDEDGLRMELHVRRQGPG